MTAQIGMVQLDAPGAREAGVGATFLVVRTDGREYALPIEHVVEVVRMVAMVAVPEAPAWVSGVINFRGRVIAVIDHRIRLGAPWRQPDLSTPIVVVRTDNLVVGLVVDEAVEVLAISGDDVDPAGGATGDSAAVSGVARVGDRLILALGRDRLCDGSFDLGLVADAEAAREAGH